MAATEPLSLLLKAEKKATVKSIFEHAFRFRDTDGVGGSAEALLGELGMEGKDVTKTGTAVMRAVSELVRDAVYSANTKADVVALCPQNLDERLKGLVADVVVSHLKEWRFVSLQQRANLQGTRLIDVDWRVDLKTSSEEVSNMSVPTVIVKLKVQPEATRAGELAPIRTVQFELTKEALGTMLDGLRKIREQLDKIASSS